VIIGAFLVLDPSLLINQVHLGTQPTWSDTIFALSTAMLAYTGIETVANMAEEARDPAATFPAPSTSSSSRCSASMPVSRLSAVGAAP